MPAFIEIASSESTLKTRPRAVTCAATQPRYEITMQTEITSSTRLS